MDSIFEQDYGNIEWIVSDDGSENFPREKIEDYIRNHRSSNVVEYKILRNEVNKGTVKNYNGAIKESSGEFIIPLSQDDVFYDSHVVSRIMKIFATCQYDVIGGTRAAINYSGKIVGFMPHIVDRKTILSWNTPEKQHAAFIAGRSLNMASGCVLSLRKSTLEKMGYFDEKYYLFEDGPFIEKYTRENMIYFYYDIPQIKYGTDGVSSAAGNKLLKTDMRLYNKTDRTAKTDMLGLFDKQAVEYGHDLAEKLHNKWLLYLRYPSVPFKILKYRIKDSWGWKSDLKYLRKNLSN
jgi:glycosyltransferase involved in cell wall biosynthesis